MQAEKPRTHTRYLFGVLGGLVVLWGAAAFETRRLEKSLAAVAGGKEREVSSMVVEGLPDKRGYRYRTISSVTALHDYVVFGPTRGKVRVFLKLYRPNGPERYLAYDYFFDRQQDGAWVQTESGVCGDPQVVSDAREAFAADAR